MPFSFVHPEGEKMLLMILAVPMREDRHWLSINELVVSIIKQLTQCKICTGINHNNNNNNNGHLYCAGIRQV